MRHGYVGKVLVKKGCISPEEVEGIIALEEITEELARRKQKAVTANKKPIKGGLLVRSDEKKKRPNLKVVGRGQTQEKSPQRMKNYPGRHGNYCNNCGGAIDEGGHCNCGIDHFAQ